MYKVYLPKILQSNKTSVFVSLQFQDFCSRKQSLWAHNNWFNFNFFNSKNIFARVDNKQFARVDNKQQINSRQCTMCNVNEIVMV